MHGMLNLVPSMNIPMGGFCFLWNSGGLEVC